MARWHPGDQAGKAAAGWKTGVGKAAAGGPDEVVDCGVGWARLQLVDQVTDFATRAPERGNKASNL